MRWLHPLRCPHCNGEILVPIGEETPNECFHCKKEVEPVTPIEKKVLEYEETYNKVEEQIKTAIKDHENHYHYQEDRDFPGQ